jgi:CRP/FNR family transcriptional regulator, cyclic AMP receptor protein
MTTVSQAAAASPGDGRGGTETSARCLLDLDRDLIDVLDPHERRIARAAATSTVIDAEVGGVPMVDWLARAADGPGILVIDGVLVLSVRVGDRVCAELIGAGDLVQSQAAGEMLVAAQTRWRALTGVRLAVLDGAFARRVRFWPSILLALARRADRRAQNLDVLRAISAQPRLEVRLALLFWHLADRWGRVERGGVRLCLPLTHQLLGQLVAAERPSVSHALARLSQSDLITGHGSEWHLHGSLDEQLPELTPSAHARTDHIIAAVTAFRREPTPVRA